MPLDPSSTPWRAARANDARHLQRGTGLGRAEQPKELQQRTARIERLRARRKSGDPDMTADEIQAAIDPAEAKRQELEQQQPAAKASAKVLSVLPKAAELYRRQIAKGLDGDEREVLKARVFLREWFGGKIRLEPLPDGGLQAHWLEHNSALLRSAGTFGSGARYAHTLRH